MFHDDTPAPAPRSLPWGSDQPAPSPRGEPEATPRDSAANWRGRDVITGSLLLAAPFALLWLLTRGAEPAEDPPPDLILFALVIQIMVQLWMGAIVFILARRRGVTLAGLGLKTVNWRTFSLIIPAWFGAYMAIGLYLGAVELLQRVTGADLGWLQERHTIPVDPDYTTAVWVGLGVSVVLAAPLMEELFFRAFVFRALETVWPTVLAMTASGLLFALVHQTVGVIIPFALIGILFAWSFRASGSLWTPILAHLLFNGVAFTLTVMGVEA